MDQFLNQGQFRSIPVFVFFDQAFHEIGRFIERPASVTTRHARVRRDFFAQHPEFGPAATPITQLPEDVRMQLSQAMATAREATFTEDTSDVVQALGQIVAGAHVA